MPSDYAHIEQQVNFILDRVRGYLQEDGGDVHFVRYEPAYSTVVVSLTGNCRGCPLSLMTLRGGIERFILHEIPEVKRIENE